MQFKYKEKTRGPDACDDNNLISRYHTAIETNIQQKLFPEKTDSTIDGSCGTDRFIELLIAGRNSKQINELNQ